MYLLDTDHMSLLEWDNQGAALLRERPADCEPDDVATTIVNYVEQVRGWMAYIARRISLVNVNATIGWAERCVERIDSALSAGDGDPQTSTASSQDSDVQAARELVARSG